MIRRLFVLLLLMVSGRLLCAHELPDAVVVGAHFKSISLEPHLSYYLDSSARLSLGQVRKREVVANAKRFINFKGTEAACWLRFEIANQDKDNQTLTLITSGLDSAVLYVLAQDSLVQIAQQGTHFSWAQRGSVSPLQTFSFTIGSQQKRTVWLRLRMTNYPLSVYPLTLNSQARAFQYVQKDTLFRSIYVGGMVIILLFAAYMALFFRGKLYLYYLLCACCSTLMILIYNDFQYFIFDELPLFIGNKNAYGFLATFLPIFYLLFAQEFVSYGYRATKLLQTVIYISIATSIVLLLFIVIFKEAIFNFRHFFYLPLTLNTALMIFMVFKAIQNGYRPAWLFVLATFPLLVIGALEALSDFHNLPIQFMHTLYYSFSLYEMYVLMLGLSGRFRAYQQERKVLQHQMFELQIQTEQKIRERIGLDLHDKVGGLISLLKINLELLGKKNAQTQDESYQKMFQILDTAADETRRISHGMMSDQLRERGLMWVLKELYEGLEAPHFLVQTNGIEHRLHSTTEMMLYGIVNECVTNILKHANAKNVAIQLSQNKNKELTLMIEDDGKGFDINKSAHLGKGLINLGVRVKEHLKGHLTIDSTPGKGTVIIIKIKQP